MPIFGPSSPGRFLSRLSSKSGTIWLEEIVAGTTPPDSAAAAALYTSAALTSTQQDLLSCSSLSSGRHAWLCLGRWSWFKLQSSHQNRRSGQGRGGSSSWPSIYNLWTGTIHMWPGSMTGRSSHCSGQQSRSPARCRPSWLHHRHHVWLHQVYLPCRLASSDHLLRLYTKAVCRLFLLHQRRPSFSSTSAVVLVSLGVFLGSTSSRQHLQHYDASTATYCY
jgi:hypothetical protein